MMPDDSSETPARGGLEWPRWALSLWAIVAAFGAYFTMYGFRKPFTAGRYSGIDLWGIDYKTVLVTAQVVGYALSKVIGIRLIAETTPDRRAWGIVASVGMALGSLLLLGLIPAPWNCVCMVLNGLPLGFVFGLILQYLEGRRLTEALSAGLCASFVLADGITKTVGSWLLEAGVPEFWMPFTASLFFGIPFGGFVWMLTRLPRPDPLDELQRSPRGPMGAAERRTARRSYGLGLWALIGVFTLLTIVRSMRADFAPEIWRGLGFEGQPTIFARAELWVMLTVVVVNGLSVLIPDNRRAFGASLLLSAAGLLLALTAPLALRLGMAPFYFMVLVGVGLYIPYIAFHTTLFERLVAMTRTPGTASYALYLADSIGYVAYVAVILTRSRIAALGEFLPFFLRICQLGSLLGLLLLGLSAVWYFGFGKGARPGQVPGDQTMS